jgi:hypothetical protein
MEVCRTEAAAMASIATPAYLSIVLSVGGMCSSGSHGPLYPHVLQSSSECPVYCTRAIADIDFTSQGSPWVSFATPVPYGCSCSPAQAVAWEDLPVAIQVIQKANSRSLRRARAHGEGQLWDPARRGAVSAQAAGHGLPAVSRNAQRH